MVTGRYRPKVAIGLVLETDTTNFATNRRGVYANLRRYAGLAFFCTQASLTTEAAAGNA